MALPLRVKKFESHAPTCDFVDPDNQFLLRVSAENDRTDLFGWISENKKSISDSLVSNGAILFSGFKLDPEGFKRVVRDVSMEEESLSYTAGVGPREKISDGIYTSTSVPSACHMLQHHEMAYFADWPMKVFFYCEVAPEIGGRTPVSNTRRVMSRLNRKLVQTFLERKVRYVRNYLPGVDFGPSWQNAFETTDRAQVEAICKARHLEFEWVSGEHLRTWHIAQGVAKHPATGEILWHNHSHNLNLYSTVPSGMTPFMKAMLPGLTPSQLEEIRGSHHSTHPYCTYYGDGEPIELAVLEEVSRVFEEEAVSFSWKEGDVILIDNMLTSHGKEPHQGKRRILVAMSDLYSKVSR